MGYSGFLVQGVSRELGHVCDKAEHFFLNFHMRKHLRMR